MSKINVGIAGFGLSGAVFHAPLLTSDGHFTIKAVATTRHDQVARQYSGVRVVEGYSELIEDSEIELIVIGLPNHLHFEVAAAALKAGKHVVLEKPMTSSLQEAIELVEIANENRCLLTVFHNRRWDGDFLTIRKLIKEGRLGEVVHYEAHFDRYRLEVDGRWKEQEGAGGGIFYDLGSHLIDQALNIFGHPDEVLLNLGTQRIDAKQPDYFHLLMNYGARRVILHGATIVYESMPRYIIHGTGGSFIKTGIDPQEESLKQGRTPSSKGWGEELQENHGQLFCRSSRGDRSVSHVPTHLGQYQSFYDGIYKTLRNGAASPMPLKDSLDVMRAIEFGMESWRQRSWVKWKP